MPTAEATIPSCGICSMIERLRADAFPDYVAELPRSWVILGDAQFYRGYCLLLAKRHVTELHLMPRGEAHELLDELLAVGRAITLVTHPAKLNYECLGNQEPHVHWHVFPRYAADDLRLQPVWMRAAADRKVTLEDIARRELIAALRAALVRHLPAARWPLAT
jgi:diadenosine tetraphosphate (Ap4A) HIT family hydrolase